LEIAEKYHRLSGFPLGATMNSQPAVNEVAPRRGAAGSNEILLAVVGAHLTGQPLNVQLTDRGATLERRCRTAAKYRLFALAQTAPAKPGLIRVSEGGAAIEVEVWRMPVESLGSFMVLVGQPLGIGTLELEDGQLVKGFICEPIATAEARDITSFGGWLNYLSSR
jgi:allophanate hydrolase